MTGPGSQNPGIYRNLKDVLRRQPQVVTVWFEPDAIRKSHLAAEIDPIRLHPPSGPKPPTLEVRWKTAPPHDSFRVDYHDPNTGFHCGWHRDDDHTDLGEIHLQYRTSEMNEPLREPVAFEAESPARLLWECCERLFGETIAEYGPTDSREE